MKIATCIPKQQHTRKAKLEWLADAVNRTKCDLFLAPQEYFGGVVAMPKDMHIEKAWLVKECGGLARKAKKALGIGAAMVEKPGGGATEDYLYFNKAGQLVGAHRKYALPRYDDVRAGGSGRLWPETSFPRRTAPVEIKELGLKIGTVFCWEVFSQAMWAGYSFAGVNLIVHPIKFAPKAWPVVRKVGAEQVVEKFAAGKADHDTWVDRLRMASKHEVFCPIAVTCNSWELGKKFLALVGHVDEMLGTTSLQELPSEKDLEHIHVFEVNPALYVGLDHLFNLASFREHTGSIEHFHDFEEWKMAFKIRRLEAKLIGGGTLLSCQLHAATYGRQDKRLLKRREKACTA